MSSGKTRNWDDKNPLHQTGLRQARSSSASNTGAYVFNLLLLDLGQQSLALLFQALRLCMCSLALVCEQVLFAPCKLE